MAGFSKFQKISKSRFLKFGLPFFTLILGGSFALSQFSQVRYRVKDSKPLTREELEKENIKLKPKSEVTLEKVYQSMQKVDIDNWENKRGPRPWEQDNPYNKFLEERAAAKREKLDSEPSKS